MSSPDDTQTKPTDDGHGEVSMKAEGEGDTLVSEPNKAPDETIVNEENSPAIKDDVGSELNNGMKLETPATTGLPGIDGIAGSAPPIEAIVAEAAVAENAAVVGATAENGVPTAETSALIAEVSQRYECLEVFVRFSVFTSILLLSFK